MAETTYEKGEMYQLELSRLVPDPDQPRKFFDPDALRELEASISSHGVLEPILVKKNGADGLFNIISGERRYQAAKNAGLATIPSVIIDGEPAEIAIIENIMREDLTAIEEAEAIERLRSLHSYVLSDLTKILGKSDSTIAEILSLNKLPPQVKDDCRNDPKTYRSILAEIAKQRTPEKMLALYTRYKESGLTRGEIRKKTAKTKPIDAPIDLAFVSAFNNKLESLDITRLDPEQTVALDQELVKLRSTAFKKMKLLKGQGGQLPAEV